ncbi:hypothetical protein LOCC1_G000493 [Lachnellula occidentalis]|uniref:Uncharacterized protein n=1 Tax=Lachnellula occidentalis TaxID=215460 RepID=A0A8H8S9T8_9HELO|nr:hypothetical protein LOCC1_G000493 [Lachnellula occidentalis]
MDDFLELGIEGIDKLVDKNFHRVPDKALHKDTYKPRNLKKPNRRRSPSLSSSEREQQRRKQQQQPRSQQDPDPNLAYQDPYTEDEYPRYINMRDNEYPYTPHAYPFPQNAPQSPPLYSQEPPRQRAQYMPAGQQRERDDFIPPSRRRSGYESDDESDSGDERYYSDTPPRRRAAMNRRRSSSYPESGGHGELAVTGKRNGNGNGAMTEQVKDRAHRYGLKDELNGVFTKSKAGLTGGAVGAVVGGWAAQKAQAATGRDRDAKGKGKAANDLLTLLGAAVGGLAVNAVIEKLEEAKEDANDEGKGGDRRDRRDKYGSESSSRRNRGRRGDDYDSGSYSR